MGTSSCSCRARVFSRRAGKWIPLHQCRPQRKGEDTPSLDKRFVAPGATREVSLRELFAAMRAHGVRPHTRGEDEDEAVAALLLGSVGEAPIEAVPGMGTGPASRAWPKPDELTPGLSDEPDADVEPSRWLGVAEPQCPTRPDDEKIFGSYVQILGDLRDMGCGHIRRCKWRDVYWGSVFPLGYDKERPDAEYTFQNGEMVPPPNEILENLRAGDFERLARFTDLLTECRRVGIKVSITPFDAGGGANLTVRANRKDLSDLDAASSKSKLVEGAWVDLLDHLPPWLQEVRVPSTEGWHEFYWNHGDAEPLERHFQRYAIQVWPTQASDWPESTEYVRECARRKSLAIAAYCQGIAEQLAALHQAWGQTFGDDGIYEVVDFVELGNEMNGGYALPGEATDDIVEAGVREAGRYMALVATPFRHLLPSMKFRAPELVSATPVRETGYVCEPAGCCVDDNFDVSLSWLREVIETGTTEALATEKRHQSAIATSIASGGAYVAPEESRLWAISCLASHYWWPPLVSDPSQQLAMSATDLVHHVGLHWYHGYNTEVSELDVRTTFTPLYRDAIRLKEACDALEAEVVDPLRAKGFRLARSAGEVAFAAVFPGLDTDASRPFYDGTNACFQAGMLARYMFAFRAAGVQRPYWFCPILKPMTTTSGQISEWHGKASGTGLHNDVADPGEYRNFAALGGWRRPAWFTYRRVSWLLSLVKGHGSFVHNSLGATVLRFELKTRLSLSQGVPRGYRYLWIAWLDQYADDECLHAARDARLAPRINVLGGDSFELYAYDARARGYELVPLVPDLDESATPGELDDNGYRQVTRRDWEWAGWDAALLSHEEDVVTDEPSSVVRLVLRKASPDVAQAPIAFLTDAEEAQVFS